MYLNLLSEVKCVIQFTLRNIGLHRIKFAPWFQFVSYNQEQHSNSQRVDRCQL